MGLKKETDRPIGYDGETHTHTHVYTRMYAQHKECAAQNEIHDAPPQIRGTGRERLFPRKGVAADPERVPARGYKPLLVLVGGFLEPFPGALSFGEPHPEGEEKKQDKTRGSRPDRGLVGLGICAKALFGGVSNGRGRPLAAKM